LNDLAELGPPADAPEDAPPETRNPFTSAPFARWWAASLLAGTGVGIQSVTVPLFIRDRVADGDRASAIAAALVAQTAPGAILALFGGVVADRVERRRILVWTYGIAALVSSAYVVLAARGVPAIWPVFALGAIVGSAGAFTNPARSSLLPLLVTRAQFQNGVILGTTGFMASFMFVGPTVAGLVADTGGLAVAFALEVALLAAGAIIFSRVPTDQPAPTGRSVIGDLVDGVRYVKGEPTLRALVLLALIPSIFFMGPFAVTLPLRVPDLFHESDRWVGILSGCFGGGVVGGSLALTFWPIPRRGLAICLANLFGAFTMLLYSQSTSLTVAGALLVVWGLNAAVFINYVVTLIQELADPRMMGRVMSMYSLVFFFATPIGYLQAGAVTTWFGTQASLVGAALAAGLVATWVLVFVSRVRRLP
jgi:MFS transporter, ENTS family, enterobactin (siderophore) exporter